MTVVTVIAFQLAIQLGYCNTRLIIGTHRLLKCNSPKYQPSF